MKYNLHGYDENNFRIIEEIEYPRATMVDLSKPAVSRLDPDAIQPYDIPWDDKIKNLKRPKNIKNIKLQHIKKELYESWYVSISTEDSLKYSWHENIPEDADLGAIAYFHTKEEAEKAIKLIKEE